MRWGAVWLSALLLAASTFAQTAAKTGSAPPRPPHVRKRSPEPRPTTEVNFLRNLALDQKAIWTAPLSVRLQDVTWLAPLGGLTAGLLRSDAQFSRHLDATPSRLQRSNNIANAGVGALVALPAGLYGWGLITHDPHKRETGLLTAEALTNTLGLVTLMKYSFGRQRPLEGAGAGDFRSGGVSFPSEHAALAWSAATVLAHEYPGPLTQLFAYGTATAVTAARITGREHFPSDVLVGSALGWFVGREVYRLHHQPEVGGTDIGEFVREGEGARPASRMASPYVPPDSWVYGVFDRLSALGYVQTGSAGQRPWTRLECARLVQEAADNLAGDDTENAEGRRLQAALAQEFAPEIERLGGGRNFEARIESLYTRVTGISGTPLRDGYHFGQTLINDYGRPYAAGVNVVSGIRTYATAGPLAFYLSGEYQHAPGDANPIERPGGNIPADELGFSRLPPQSPLAEVNRFRALDAYVALNFAGWQASFGRQSLWWGPGASGPLLWSDNAEPVTMLRLRRSTPMRLPSLLAWLGPTDVDAVIGRLAGQHFVYTAQHGLVGSFSSPLANQPFVNAEKITFHPTANLEFGVSLSGILGGPDFPITWDRVLRHLTATATANGIGDAGDRRTGFDFSYRVPYLRNWLVLYNDSMAEDEVSPIAYPRRSAMNPGIYLPRLPRLPKLDFRAEAVYTDLPGLLHKGFYYWNLRYLDGYTNRGNILGSWVGREGRGLLLQSTYWLTARNTVQVGFRKQGVDPAFLQGGTLHDAFARGEVMLRNDLQLSARVQYERWNFPLLAPGVKNNVTTSFQLTYSPQWRAHWPR